MYRGQFRRRRVREALRAREPHQRLGGVGMALRGPAALHVCPAIGAVGRVAQAHAAAYRLIGQRP